MNDIPRLKGRRRSLHDQVFKDLLGTFLPDLLTLVAPEPAGRLDLSHWKFLDKEVFTDWPKGQESRRRVPGQEPAACLGSRGPDAAGGDEPRGAQDGLLTAHRRCHFDRPAAYAAGQIAWKRI